MKNERILDWLGTMASTYKTMLDKTDHQFVQITLTRQMAQEFVDSVDELQKEMNRLYKMNKPIAH